MSVASTLPASPGAATEPYRRRKTRWGSVFFFAALHAVGLVGAPLYIWRCGVTPFEAFLFLFYCAATIFSITVGYHRLYAHASYQANAVVRFLLLFFGAASFEQSALRWASMHRTHHRYTDTARDPYDIKSGFWYAHIGWILFWKHTVDYANVADLQKSRLVMHQHRYFQWWALAAGVLVPAFLGLAAGHLVGALVLAVGARLMVVFHLTFLINSYQHTFGTAEYDYRTSARDHWFGAVLTNGEGYHNFHHRFPSDYRNGVLRHHWDPTKWVIWCLERLGWARDLRRTPPEKIEEARRETREARLKALGPSPA
jgi:stearoyl-CoA desaturase (delta-9 desaturase)